MELNKSVFVEARQWVDKTYGNSYFAGRIWVNGELVAKMPFQYGYESQYQYEAMKTLVDLGVAPADLANRPLWYLKDLGYAVYSTISEAKKADTKRFGEVN